jgi:predicted SpoU family rRNA methylase
MGENLLQTTGASGKHPHACRITRTLNEVITTLGGEVVCKLQRTWESAVNQFRRVPAFSDYVHFGSRPPELQ